MRYRAFLATIFFAPVLIAFSAYATEQPTVIAANDNRTPAGHLRAGALELHLELRAARWYAEAPDGVYKEAYAFAEKGHSPQCPGPLVRVPQDTSLHISLHNLLPSAAKVYGLHSYPGDANSFIEIGAGETRQIQFDSGAPGTYLYWATTSDAHFDRDEQRQGAQTLLTGAFVVDPSGGAAPDRIFVIVSYSKVDFTSGQGEIIFGINGKGWPESERLRYKVGETTHWRIINATSMAHAMHLHGFYFTVDGVGDASRFSPYSEAQRRQAVTEGIEPGHSFAMTWTPDRPGNWLFHCHMTLHMEPQLPLHPELAKAGPEMAKHDPASGMGGLVMGITVDPRDDSKPANQDVGAARKLQLVVSENPTKIPLFQLKLNDPAAIAPSQQEQQPALLGPPIFLTRGEPAEIEVKNDTTHATAIHWHGLELQSYYDGVPGWSGSSNHTAPAIEPGGSFVAHITPTRAGTFIYHSHWHDQTAIRNGLYGPLIVLEPGQKFDADAERIFLFSVGSYRPLGFMMLINGKPAPDPQPLQAGKHYRFRLINITDEGADLRVRLFSRDKLVSWIVVARDGAELPPSQQLLSPADMVLTVGSTCDVDVAITETGISNLQVSSEDLLSITLNPFFVVSK
jgi:FtsP/CotA-like multicopper oxidase with cupredoxin domain